MGFRNNIAVSEKAVVVQRLRRWDELFKTQYRDVMVTIGELLVREAQGQHLRRRWQGTGQLLNAINYKIESGRGRTRGPKGRFDEVRVGSRASLVTRPTDHYFLVNLGVDREKSVSKSDPQGLHGFYQEYGTGIYGPRGAKYKGRGPNKAGRRPGINQPRTPSGQFRSFRVFMVEGHEANPFIEPALEAKREAVTRFLELQTRQFTNRIEG